MRLIVVIFFLAFTAQSYSVNQSDSTLFLIKDEGYKDTGNQEVMDYMVDLSFFETKNEFKSKLPTIYFVSISKKMAFDTVSSKVIGSSELREAYKKQFNYFSKDMYWIDNNGKRISFDLNTMYRRIYIIEKIDSQFYKTEVKQADVIID